MNNQELARIFNSIADLLDIKGENRFRILSYRRAAETISALAEELTDVVAQGRDPCEFPGIGEAISKKILEALGTGKVTFLEELKKELPPTLLDLLRIRGVGPRAVKVFYEQLGVTTLEELKEATRSDKLRSLPGFGERSQGKILAALQDLEESLGRFRLDAALVTADELAARLKQVKGIRRVVAAGSLRRRRETVGDLDILVTCTKPRAVMEHFVAYERVAQVVAQGETRSTVILNSGLQVDVRVVPEQSFGSALCYFTGSKDHNVVLREMARAADLKLNEYGLFRGEKRIAGRSEEEVYEALGLPFIPPELRENRGEIEAARQGKLPALIELGSIRADLQAHSTWSDGSAGIEEMTRAAKALGRTVLAITDHSKAVRIAGGLDEKRVREQKKEIEEVRRKVKGVTLLHGSEVDILEDGSLDHPRELLDELDLVVAAVHSRFEMPRKKMTDRIVRAIASGAVHILAHPTGRIIGERPPYEVDLEAVFAAAKEHKVALELNAHPARLDLSDIFLKRAKEHGVPVTINTDAHSAAQLQHMKFGIYTARRGWLERDDVLNTKTPPALERWLRR